MIVKIKLKDVTKYTLTTSMGSFGRIKLLIHWNSIAEKWVMGAEYINGEPLFYGQTMIPNINLFKSWRNQGVPDGRLSLIDEVKNRNDGTLPTLDNITEYTLYYFGD